MKTEIFGMLARLESTIDGYHLGYHTIRIERGIWAIVDPATALGICADIWVDGRDREPIKESLAVAHALHWAPVLAKALRRNKKEGKCPRSIQEVADLLCRDQRNIYRWKAGQYAGSMSDFLALSMVVNVPIGEFFPEESWLVARAAALLCGNNVGIEECRSYGAYCAARPRRSNPELDPDALAGLAAEDGEEKVRALESAILATARRVGQALLDHGWTYPHRRWSL